MGISQVYRSEIIPLLLLSVLSVMSIRRSNLPIQQTMQVELSQSQTANTRARQGKARTKVSFKFYFVFSSEDNHRPAIIIINCLLCDPWLYYHPPVVGYRTLYLCNYCLYCLNISSQSQNIPTRSLSVPLGRSKHSKFKEQTEVYQKYKPRVQTLTVTCWVTSDI